MPLILPGNVASAIGGGYEVANSCRFNDGDSAGLSRTFGTPSSTTTWTISFWVKKCTNGSALNLCAQGVGTSNEDRIRFDSSDKLEWTIYKSGVEGKLVTNRVFRDPSAWYNIVCRYDSTNGTAGDRMRIFVNGTEETSFATDTNPDQNETSNFNTAAANYVGQVDSGGEYFDGYMAEVCFIDGTALTATSFGEFDEDSPTIWKPIDVSGLTFGDNGFYLDFEDSGDLDDDESGNSNDFTVSNLAAVDQATDTPTNNFCTLNPLIYNPQATTYSQGNCVWFAPAAPSFERTTGTIAVSTGKWYWEALMAAALTSHFIGVVITNPVVPDDPMYAPGTTSFYNNDGGEIDTAGTKTTADYGTFDTDNVMGIALDMDAGSYGQFTIYKDNSAIASNIDLSSTTGDGFITPFVAGFGSTIAVNFGGCPGFAITSAAADENGYGTFEFAPPSGYLALCTKNLGSDGG